MNTDLAYLYGLIVGGGRVQNGILEITLPYNKWGDVAKEPVRAGKIAGDILAKVKPLFKANYNLDVSYQVVKNKWKIISDKPCPVLLNKLKILLGCNSGEFKKVADLSVFKKKLVNNELKANFVCGLVDSIGSLAPSHRRFIDEFQIISFEFSGKNFLLVRDIAEILTEIGCAPDQILWNHPNFHSSADRYYKNWKKGFKVRVSLDDYISNSSFVFRAKQDSAYENLLLREGVQTTKYKVYSMQGRVCLHRDISSDWIPDYMRGKVFVHFLQMSKFLKLGLDTHANAFLNQLPLNYAKYISPFTILTKGSQAYINEIIEFEDYLAKGEYRKEKINVKSLCELLALNSTEHILGLSKKDGFSLRKIMEAIAYLYCAETQTNIKGKRVLGSYKDIISSNMSAIEKMNISFYIPNRGTAIIVRSKNYASLVGYYNESFNRSISSLNASSITIESPIFQKCVKL